MEELLEVARPYLAQVARTCARPARGSQSVSDLVQEAEVRVWQKLDQFCGGKNDAESLAMFRSWLAQIVRRVGLNLERKRGAQRRRPAAGRLLRQGGPLSGGRESGSGAAELAGSGSTPIDQAIRKEEALRLHAAMERLLDETARAVVRLHAFEGLSLRKVAQRLELSYDEVRDRYRSSLRRLEEEMLGGSGS